NHIVEGVRAAESIDVGILLEGSDNTIHDSMVVDTGGRGVGRALPGTVGILMRGERGRVAGCDVLDTLPNDRSEAVSILIDNGSESGVEGNRVSSGASARTTGIRAKGRGRVRIEGNHLSRLGVGISRDRDVTIDVKDNVLEGVGKQEVVEKGGAR